MRVSRSRVRQSVAWDDRSRNQAAKADGRNWMENAGCSESAAEPTPADSVAKLGLLEQVFFESATACLREQAVASTVVLPRVWSGSLRKRAQPDSGKMRDASTLVLRLTFLAVGLNWPFQLCP